MPKMKRKNPSRASQNCSDEKNTDDFVSVARRLECDEDKERFETKLRKIARQKPKASSGASKSSKTGKPR